MTAAETPRQMWERIAAPLWNADSYETNAEELGYELDSDEFFINCIQQAAS